MNAQTPDEDGRRSATSLPDDPNELPYPGYAREMAAMQAKSAAAARMRGEPLPGPLREAFAGEPRRLHGFTFQPVCAWLIAILRRIESPILDGVKIYSAHAEEVAEAQKIISEAERIREVQRIQAIIDGELKALKPTADATIQMVFAFVTDVEKCQELLDSDDPKAFVRAARKALGKLAATKFAELERACGEHFAASFATGLEISAVRKEDPGETVFTQPPATMESAGGSKSLEP